MRELLRTNDMVLLSWSVDLLEQASIEVMVADYHSSIVEGSIGAIPQRLLVCEEDFEVAMKLLRQSMPDLPR